MKSSHNLFISFLSNILIRRVCDQINVFSLQALVWMAFISDIRCYIMYLNILFKLSHLLRGNNIILITCHDCEVLFSFYVAVVLETYLCNCQSSSCQILEHASLNCISVVLHLSTLLVISCVFPLQTGYFFGEVEGAVMNKLLTMGSFKR